MQPVVRYRQFPAVVQGGSAAKVFSPIGGANFVVRESVSVVQIFYPLFSLRLSYRVLMCLAALTMRLHTDERAYRVCEVRKEYYVFVGLSSSMADAARR